MYPSPIFSVFGRDVYLYGLMIAVGLIACLIVLYVYTKKFQMPEKVQDFVYFVAIFGIVFGFLFATLFQAFYDYLENPSRGFVINGSLTVMGGIVGGAVCFLLIYFIGGHFYFKKKNNEHLKWIWEVVRVAPVCITVAHGFGRIGCMFAGCCHGIYLGSDYVFGGIWSYASDTGIWGYYIPTQLYEALFLFALAAVLSVLYFKRYNFTMTVYLISYGVWRIFIEFFRADHRGGVGFFSPSQWQSFLFIAIGIALLIVCKKFLHFPRRKVFPMDEESVGGEAKAKA